MSIYEQFIPGQWSDNIDVNDFVNLNKKPFFEEPLFLQNSSEKTLQLFQKLQEQMQQETWNIHPDVSTLEKEKAQILDQNNEIIPGIQSVSFQKKMAQSESIEEMKEVYSFSFLPKQSTNTRNAYQLFQEVSTTDIKKALKMSLFSHTPTSFNPSFMNPDVRKIALYGTKQVIKDKKLYLKTLEKHLQTHEWMERRMAIHREIESLKNLEKFTRLYGVNVQNPATNAWEAISFTFLSILACVIENPSISFSLTQVIPFFDIYLEKDLQNHVITEKEAQELVEQFYLKLCTIRFVHSPHLTKQFSTYPHFFGETFGGKMVTKTTYRFLHALQTFQLYPFSVRVIWDPSLPLAFRSFCQNLLKIGIPLSFVNSQFLREKYDEVLFPYGLTGIAGEEVLFDAGHCNLILAFYAALNGGKDVHTNSNLAAVTQPSRGNTIEYEEALTKFKDFLSYALSLYVELMNVVVYLNESKNYYPLRSSLMNNLLFYHVQFGFTHLKKVAQLLHSLSIGSYEIKRNSSGWITEICPLSTDSEESELIMVHLVSFLQQELKKIPLYKSGKAKIRMFEEEVNNWSSEDMLKKHITLPPEFSDAAFHHSFLLSKETAFDSLLEQWFKEGSNEIHLSTDPSHRMINGILFKKDE